MKKLAYTKIRVEGHPSEILYVYPGPSRCGKILDGVSFEFGDHTRGTEGGWVISYDDLVLLATLATAARSSRAQR